MFPSSICTWIPQCSFFSRFIKVVLPCSNCTQNHGLDFLSLHFLSSCFVFGSISNWLPEHWMLNVWNVIWLHPQLEIVIYFVSFVLYSVLRVYHRENGFIGAICLVCHCRYRSILHMVLKRSHRYLNVSIFVRLFLIEKPDLECVLNILDNGECKCKTSWIIFTCVLDRINMDWYYLNLLIREGAIIHS